MAGRMGGTAGPFGWARPDKRELGLINIFGAIGLIFPTSFQTRFDEIAPLVYGKVTLEDLIRFVAAHEFAHRAVMFPEALERLSDDFPTPEEHKASVLGLLTEQLMGGDEAADSVIRGFVAMSLHALNKYEGILGRIHHLQAAKLFIAELIEVGVIKEETLSLAAARDYIPGLVARICNILVKSAREELQEIIGAVSSRGFPSRLYIQE